jgi:hypothetical protein
MEKEAKIINSNKMDLGTTNKTRMMGTQDPNGKRNRRDPVEKVDMP